MIKAVQAGEVAKAAALAAGLTSPGERQLWRATLAILSNDPVTAIRTLRAGPGNPAKQQHPKTLGVAYYLARQYLLFRGLMEEAIRQNPGDFGPYYFLGRHYDSDLDNCAEAVRWFRQALDRSPGYARTHAHLGSCLERLGKAKEAEQSYRTAIDLPLSQLGMARLEHAAGNDKAALDWAGKALAADPGDVAGQRFAARLYELAGRPAAALAALEQAIKAAPNDASLHYSLHRLYRARGDETKAKAQLREFERVRAIYGAQPQ